MKLKAQHLSSRDGKVFNGQNELQFGKQHEAVVRRGTRRPGELGPVSHVKQTSGGSLSFPVVGRVRNDRKWLLLPAVPHLRTGTARRHGDKMCHHDLFGHQRAGAWRAFQVGWLSAHAVSLGSAHAISSCKVVKSGVGCTLHGGIPVARALELVASFLGL